jgi:carbamoyl-phosphate synthase large subunit
MLLEPTRLLASKGYRIYATKGTSAFLSEYHVPNTCVETEEALQLLHNHTIELVISIHRENDLGNEHKGYQVRRAAIDLNVPVISNPRLAGAFIYACCAVPLDQLDILAWDEYK